MKTKKGPAIFLAQFGGDEPPFNSLKSIAEWAAGHGYKAIQLPSWDSNLFNRRCHINWAGCKMSSALG